jgi:hypothetical protein
VKCTHHLEIRIKTEFYVDDPRVQVPLQFKQFQTLNQSHKTELQKQSMLMAPQNHRCSAESKTSSATSTVDQEIVIPEPPQGVGDIHVPSYDEHYEGEVMTAVVERADAGPQNVSFRSPLDNYLKSTARNSKTRDVTNNLKSDYSTATSSSSLLDAEESTTDTVVKPSEENKVSKRKLQTQVKIPLSQIHAGGRVRIVRNNIDDDSKLSLASKPEPSTEEEPQDVLPSIENLLKEMMFSVDDFDIVCCKLGDPTWRSIFFQISPDEFGSMLAHVNLDHDQPKVAAMVAGQVFIELDFTCQHIIHALRNAADWTRASIVQRLLPFCSDLIESKELLTQELTPWELTVLAGDLEKAIRNRQRSSQVNEISYIE